ncbi:recombinase family protein [Anaerobacillus alkalidiazotrophicus]|uniref:Recombinase family protein n=1 Tax=Anaerobacillus alkalidiazotrophicus TaxID=472963 RepID=A0A1S2MB88_9BACI|nr:recombinase family protein [Anaerobacillus alkalidiazotrophicus]OIJ22028.1 recombinase family protein [Anaerobacillus alkalidiazotrophicus]
MDRVCMYLRKSRADLEAESRGEGETLAKHKKALLKTAKQLNLNIIKIREEIVSGESLMHRPEMLELLKEIENKQYDGVLVMDMDRLGRGNMQEQGLILETFQKAKTKIITPRKTYDLSDEWDEEYSEFEAFMARKELKIINRRLQGGRIRSIEEGNYIATLPPYGYVIKDLDNGRTLEPHPDQAPVIKMIFDWYTNSDHSRRLATGHIANELNSLGYKTYTGKSWTGNSVLNIIKNAVYAGRLQWKRKEIKKSITPGKVKDTRTRDKAEWIDVLGKHEPLISMETYQKAQEILKKKYHVPYQLLNPVRNPLAGLIRCGHCGAAMVYRPYTRQAAHLMCSNKHCHSRSARFDYVEKRVIEALRMWLEQFKANWEAYTPKEDKGTEMLDIKRKSIILLQKELEEMEQQKNRLHDFLERGVYDEETFLDRSQLLSKKTNDIRLSIEEIKVDLQLENKREEAQKNIIPIMENVLDVYYKDDDAERKNVLLKTVLDKAIYKKEKHQRNDDFELVLYPLIKPFI